VNVCGHRISTAEVEAALLKHTLVAEAAVVGVTDNLTGQALAAFVSLNNQSKTTQVTVELKELVREAIGTFALPKSVYIVDDIPKTRSGKITRRILRKILDGQSDHIGDTSTVINPFAIEAIRYAVEKNNQ
jgi:acetyl-CoA synthetase